jgi:hypothetical protein
MMQSRYHRGEFVSGGIVLLIPNSLFCVFHKPCRLALDFGSECLGVGHMRTQSLRRVRNRACRKCQLDRLTLMSWAKMFIPPPYMSGQGIRVLQLNVRTRHPTSNRTFRGPLLARPNTIWDEPQPMAPTCDVSKRRCRQNMAEKC